MKEKLSEQGRTPYDGLRYYSALTHGIGIVLAILGMVVLGAGVRRIAAPPATVAAVWVYCASMLCLYTASTVYHSWRTSVAGRGVLRKLDHVMIYVLIAGTYTPVCVLPLGGTMTGKIMLTAIWILAAAGSFFTMAWIKMPRALASAIYIGMGWIAIFAIYPLASRLSTLGFTMLLAGGLAYTVGGALYALKWPGRDNPRFGCHEVFHVFIVLGSVFHFLMIYSMLR